MGAIGERGFDRPTYSDVYQQMETRLQDVLGKDIDTGEEGFLGKLLRILAFEYATLYEDLEGVYYARFPDTAQGVQLDRLLSFVGVARNPAVAAVFRVRLEGAPGQTVAAGQSISGNGRMFALEEDVTLDENGTAEGDFVCTVPGLEGNLPPGALELGGVPAQKDAEGRFLPPVQVVRGRGAETDAELRRRWKSANQGMGSGTLDAVMAEVLRVPGVMSCTVAENDSGEEREGVPPHAFTCYVMTSEELENDPDHIAAVAAAIFNKKPVGVHSAAAGQGGRAIRTHVSDTAGQKHAVGFNWATRVELYLRVEVLVDTGFPGDGEQRIRQALEDTIGRLYNGEPVIYTRLLPPVLEVDGVKDVRLLAVDTQDPPAGQQNIPVAAQERAVVLPGNITVKAVPYETA